MKCCIACEYLSLSFGDAGYSDMTPGYPGEMYCCKGHFRNVDDGETAKAHLLSKGHDCRDFKLSDLARSKGWPE